MELYCLKEQKQKRKKPPTTKEKFNTRLNTSFPPNVLNDVEYEDSAIIGALQPLALDYKVKIENPEFTDNSVRFVTGLGKDRVDSGIIDMSDTDKEGLVNALKSFIRQYALPTTIEKFEQDSGDTTKPDAY